MKKTKTGGSKIGFEFGSEIKQSDNIKSFTQELEYDFNKITTEVTAPHDVTYDSYRLNYSDVTKGSEMNKKRYFDSIKTQKDQKDSIQRDELSIKNDFVPDFFFKNFGNDDKNLTETEINEEKINEKIKKIGMGKDETNTLAEMFDKNEQFGKKQQTRVSVQ